MLLTVESTCIYSQWEKLGESVRIRGLSDRMVFKFSRIRPLEQLWLPSYETAFGVQEGLILWSWPVARRPSSVEGVL